MNYLDALTRANKEIMSFKGQTLDILEIKQPRNVEYAKYLAKIISKISPLIGNMIEFLIVEKLNEADWQGLGKWIRQDPGFPDAVFQGELEPRPGIEIKTWFPFATEITARFKESVLHFEKDQTNVAVVAWLPEFLIYGRPKVIDIWIGSAKSIAQARDRHYHRPPDYLVFEPEETSFRTANLQQTNTNGYKFQGSEKLLQEAMGDIRKWGEEGLIFSPDSNYQKKIKGLLGKYSYRLDTNFAKMDRIKHSGLEGFKAKMLTTEIDGKTILEWSKSEWGALP